MANTCKTCRHPRRAEIEHDLLNSVPIRDVAAKYGVGRMSLQRHQQEGHIAASVIEAVKLRKLAFSEDLLDKVMSLQNEALQILGEAKGARETEGLKVALNMALNAIGRAGQLLETQAKLAGQLREAGAVNIAVVLGQLPEWRKIVELLVEVLRPHPEALVRVLRGLDELEVPVRDQLTRRTSRGSD